MDTTNLDFSQLAKPDDWQYLKTLLPSDLDATALAHRAIVRCRKFPNAEVLLRSFLMYAALDLSFKDAAALMTLQGDAEIAGPSLFYRFKLSEKWLTQVLGQLLQSNDPFEPAGMRLRLVDATVITGPASTGTDYRAHVVYDPFGAKITSVEVTDSTGGEGLGRHPIEANDLMVGDRAYSTANGIASVRQRKGHVLTRLITGSIRLCNEAREVIKLKSMEKDIPSTGVITYNMMLPIPPERQPNTASSWSLKKAIDWIPVRVFAARTRKNEVIWLVTTTSEEEIPSSKCMEIYQLRWQIELKFKRLKSLLNLGNLKSKNGPSAVPWILSKLIAAALIQKLSDPEGALSPYGYRIQ